MTAPLTARETLDRYAALPCPSWRELDRLEHEAAVEAAHVARGRHRFVEPVPTGELA